jgi:uncharacterized glyoxalase superfamily protein PhnB
MSKIETYRKQAKLLLRWHSERNYSVGKHIRMIERYRHLTDIDVLDMPMPLALAQEAVAIRAGFKDWASLKASVNGVPSSRRQIGALRLCGVVPILFVSNVRAAAEFYQSKLGFRTDFLHGKPPFYASVSRDGICLHLRHVHRPNFVELAAQEQSLILATIEVTDVKALFAEFEARKAEFAQRLVNQAWGGLNFHVRDPDGNCISFVEYRTDGGPADEPQRQAATA